MSKKIKPVYITRRTLVNLGACRSQRDMFRDIFPRKKKVELTEENIAEYGEYFNSAWLFYRLLDKLSSHELQARIILQECDVYRNSKTKRKKIRAENLRCKINYGCTYTQAYELDEAKAELSKLLAEVDRERKILYLRFILNNRTLRAVLRRAQ